MSTLALALAASSTAADVSPGVISQFRGQIVISKDELPDGKNDKDAVTKIKAVQLHEVVGTASDDVVHWHFHYTAFLSKPGATALKIQFLTEKEGRLSADQQLEGVDPKSNVLSGDISIDEDEGLAKGKTYSVEIVAGNASIAKTTVTFK